MTIQEDLIYRRQHLNYSIIHSVASKYYHQSCGRELSYNSEYVYDLTVKVTTVTLTVKVTTVTLTLKIMLSVVT